MAIIRLNSLMVVELHLQNSNKSGIIQDSSNRSNNSLRITLLLVIVGNNSQLSSSHHSSMLAIIEYLLIMANKFSKRKMKNRLKVGPWATYSNNSKVEDHLNSMQAHFSFSNNSVEVLSREIVPDLAFLEWMDPQLLLNNFTTK